jgi:hypothetical protein
MPRTDNARDAIYVLVQVAAPGINPQPQARRYGECADLDIAQMQWTTHVLAHLTRGTII